MCALQKTGQKGIFYTISVSCQEMKLINTFGDLVCGSRQTGDSGGIWKETGHSSSNILTDYIFLDSFITRNIYNFSLFINFRGIYKSWC